MQDSDEVAPPLPEGPIENLLTFGVFWIAVIGLIFPAWSIGTPWGWFVYAGTLGILALFVEVRNLNNTLVRTLPALREVPKEMARNRRAARGKLHREVLHNPVALGGRAAAPTKIERPSVLPGLFAPPTAPTHTQRMQRK